MCEVWRTQTKPMALSMTIMRASLALSRLQSASRLAVLLLLAGGASTGGALDGTLMFLHVWKCGGTSLRKLMCGWAEAEKLPCATVASCRSLSLQVFCCSAGDVCSNVGRCTGVR